MRYTEDCLRRHQKVHFKPILTDRGLMPRVMSWYDEYNSMQSKPLRKGCAGYNFIVAAILLYYYVPSSIASYNIPKTYRREIAGLLGCEPTFISHKKNDILFLYMKDKAFQNDMNGAIGYIQKKIDELYRTPVNDL